MSAVRWRRIGYTSRDGTDQHYYQAKVGNSVLMVSRTRGKRTFHCRVTRDPGYPRKGGGLSLYEHPGLPSVAEAKKRAVDVAGILARRGA